MFSQKIDTRPDDQVLEPPRRLIIAVVALGMMVGALCGDSPTKEAGVSVVNESANVSAATPDLRDEDRV